MILTNERASKFPFQEYIIIIPEPRLVPVLVGLYFIYSMHLLGLGLWVKMNAMQYISILKRDQTLAANVLYYTYQNATSALFLIHYVTTMQCGEN